MPLQFGHGGQQRPDLAVFHADVAIAAFTFVAGEAYRLHLRQLLRQHLADLVAAFQRAQVPAEKHQVAPIAFVLEQAGNGINLLVAQRGVQAGEHRVQSGIGGVCLHVLSPCPGRASWSWRMAPSIDALACAGRWGVKTTHANAVPACDRPWRRGARRTAARCTVVPRHTCCSRVWPQAPSSRLTREPVAPHLAVDSRAVHTQLPRRFRHIAAAAGQRGS
ncbi:hypothetical protein G6F65_018099 [Rhizopus arrhizus]|nr:hypothetical protein G6F65_018099 [Rhizopus arrhizus]